ncbi:uncharacterized protein SPPG_05202 [Spizellomyces punctatus DAOM BR117]|uniref:alkaline phosphatase n=1 Tax=Spizellomyces punctatus (strain DAOM BR117) TaxID=645134 RepID=A0A0L0HG86_SPIPD|nr:hypothetical protein, variant [Spizellomyces punctatus DAOM BR117]XP_016607869.1 uncharacterized protein SPPG_05202 [Spizellomyces punctatus DAOM BR117]KNC99828.1 hypothetical protein, variant [Spizellomyces punctatus DAOM BR117]KNC99829.1 hypothetical protein SPPG_05202 [Spizellomyces punctatus DAOM BR117]|eukprot:XP_016607868.1 hypothetical protein, variant [Spizellomyces punctatus DAOM BR117]
MVKVTELLTLALLSVATVGAINPASVPEQSQHARYRAAPRGSLLSVVPVDGAEFLAGQHYDISIELHAVDTQTPPPFTALQATINGQPFENFFSKSYSPVETWNYTYFVDSAARDSHKQTLVGVSRIALRSVKIDKAGEYKVSVQVDGGKEKVEAVWKVRSFGAKRWVKNLVLFIGDGMAPTMISAARYISKQTTFGKFGTNFLNMELLGAIGKIATNGLDSIITDSANSAHAYNTGHKSSLNALGVYPDTSGPSLDDPKVETLAEILRRTRPDMCIGIVTTAEVQDATPAAVFSHTRLRGDKAIITDQMINPFNFQNITWDPKPVKADVYMGGGGKYFCNTNSTDPAQKSLCSSLKNQDYYENYRKNGYTVVKSQQELDAYNGNGPIVGIFALNNLDTWIERTLWKDNLKIIKSHPDGNGQSATEQPGLQAMTLKAIEVMDRRCKDGWFLMSEGASIDKSMHPMDFDRGLADLLELDRTIKAVKEYDAAHYQGQTAIIVTADHSQAFDVYGSVDTQYFNQLPSNDDLKIGSNATEVQKSLQIQKRFAIGGAWETGWPTLITDPTTDVPTLETIEAPRYKLAAGKVDAVPHHEDFQIRKKPSPNTTPLTREPAIVDKGLSAIFGKDVGVPNPADDNLDGHGSISVSPNLNPEEIVSQHSLQAVDLYCAGPDHVKMRCSRVMDNTELFFIMADALGLGSDSSNSELPPGSVSSSMHSAVPSALLTTVLVGLVAMLF